MAIRSADFGGATSFHGKFGDAKVSIEGAVGHICQAHKEDGVVPSRWELRDNVLLLPLVQITSPKDDDSVFYPGDLSVEFASVNATSFELFGSFNGGAFVSLGTGVASPIAYTLLLANIGTFEIYVVATGPDGSATSAHVVGEIKTPP